MDRKMLIILAPNTSLCSLLALKEMRLSGPCPGHNSRDVRSACACLPWYVRGAHMRACTRARLLVRLSLCPAVCFCLARPCTAVVLHPGLFFLHLHSLRHAAGAPPTRHGPRVSGEFLVFSTHLLWLQLVNQRLCPFCGWLIHNTPMILIPSDGYLGSKLAELCRLRVQKLIQLWCVRCSTTAQKDNQGLLIGSIICCLRHYEAIFLCTSTHHWSGQNFWQTVSIYGYYSWCILWTSCSFPTLCTLVIYSWCMKVVRFFFHLS